MGNFTRRVYHWELLVIRRDIDHHQGPTHFNIHDERGILARIEVILSGKRWKKKRSMTSAHISPVLSRIEDADFFGDENLSPEICQWCENEHERCETCPNNNPTIDPLIAAVLNEISFGGDQSDSESKQDVEPGAIHHWATNEVDRAIFYGILPKLEKLRHDER
jgi:hypothetical protein